MVDVELQPHRKNILNFFVCMKLKLFYLIYSLGGYNRNKTRPRRPRIQILRKWLQFRVDAIPSKPGFIPFIIHNSAKLSNHKINTV